MNAMTKTIKILLIGMLGFCLAFPALSGQTSGSSRFDRGSYINKNDTIPYRFVFPKILTHPKKYALISGFTGAGERGNNNEAQLKYGTQLFLNDTIRAKYPAIVIFPQCPADSYWSNVDKQTDASGKIVFHFRRGGRPNPSNGRIYWA